MPRIIVITGNGKGKTTSALGMVLRAVGHEMRVSIIQFIKSRTDTGEIAALSHFSNVTITQFGLGFIMPNSSPDILEKHREAALNGLSSAIDALINTSVNMIVLDEICGTVYHGLLSEDAIIDAIQQAHKDAIIICTGRNAPKSLIDIADTVSVINSVKHGFERGIKAQIGVEM